MTTTDTQSDLQRYVEQNLPSEMREGAPPPEEYTGSPDDWEQSQKAARRLKTIELQARFHAMLTKGFTPAELLGDEDIEVYGDGRPVRAPEPTIPAALEAQARTGVQELAKRNLHIDTVLETRLEHAAGRRWQGEARPIEQAIQTARNAVATYDSEQAQARAEAASRPMLVVRFDFRAKQRSFARGRNPIDPALAQELRAWQAAKEAEAASHGWEFPSGFNKTNWPPFSLEGI